jgi:hypothetical protein
VSSSLLLLLLLLLFSPSLLIDLTVRTDHNNLFACWTSPIDWHTWANVSELSAVALFVRWFDSEQSLLLSHLSIVIYSFSNKNDRFDLLIEYDMYLHETTNWSTTIDCVDRQSTRIRKRTCHSLSMFVVGNALCYMSSGLVQSRTRIHVECWTRRRTWENSYALSRKVRRLHSVSGHTNSERERENNGVRYYFSIIVTCCIPEDNYSYGMTEIVLIDKSLFIRCWREWVQSAEQRIKIMERADLTWYVNHIYIYIYKCVWNTRMSIFHWWWLVGLSNRQRSSSLIRLVAWR